MVTAQIDTLPSGAIVGIRYVNFFINPCHPSCETCKGPGWEDCLTCFPNSGSKLYYGECMCD